MNENKPKYRQILRSGLMGVLTLFCIAGLLASTFVAAGYDNKNGNSMDKTSLTSNSFRLCDASRAGETGREITINSFGRIKSVRIKCD